MTTLHALRRSRKLSLSQLAELTGVPARRLAEYEYEERPLLWKEREALAAVFDVSVLQISAGISVARAVEAPTLQPQQAYILGALAATAALSLSLRLAMPSLPSTAAFPSITQPAPTTASVPSPTPEPSRVVAVAPVAAPRAGSDAQTSQSEPGPTAAPATIRAAALPTATADPTPTLPPTNTPEPVEPHRCPVVPARGRVVVTQGYGVGTHQPVSLNGALDLAVDADGNGLAEPGTTRGATVVAAHAGTVTVGLNSWPAGNHIWVEGADGWRTGYAHLHTVLVQTGDVVTAGQPLGAVGNTGRAGGPHLDIQVWREGRNVDPTEMFDC